MKNKKETGRAETLRERIRKAADSLKEKSERAKNMSEENINTMENEQQEAQ